VYHLILITSFMQYWWIYLFDLFSMAQIFLNYEQTYNSNRQKQKVKSCDASRYSYDSFSILQLARSIKKVILYNHTIMLYNIQLRAFVSCKFACASRFNLIYYINTYYIIIIYVQMQARMMFIHTYTTYYIVQVISRALRIN